MYHQILVFKSILYIKYIYMLMKIPMTCGFHVNASFMLSGVFLRDIFLMIIME